MRTRATRSPRRWSSRDASRDLDLRWFEEPCRWTNDRRWMRDVRYMTGVPVVRRPERDHPARAAGPRRGRRHRRLQLRRLVGRVGRRSGARPPGCAPPSGSSWGTTRSRRSARTCWRACRTTPSPSASTRSATRSSGASRTCPRRVAGGRYRLPDGPGFGIDLDWDYVRAHTVDTRVSTAVGGDRDVPPGPTAPCGAWLLAQVRNESGTVRPAPDLAANAEPQLWALRTNGAST